MADETTVVEDVVVPETTVPATNEAPEPGTKEYLERENAELKRQLEAKQAAPEEGGPDDQTPMPIKWKQEVVKILGPDFQCEFVQPDNGGSIFKIIVPREKSNASQAHWEMHNRDVRSREIGNTGLTGVTDWCLKVRANLIRSGINLIQYP
jgi:hypothetical protein